LISSLILVFLKVFLCLDSSIFLGVQMVLFGVSWSLG
jgi:hypothetical protein